MIAVALEHCCSKQTSKHIHIVKERSSKQTNRRYTLLYAYRLCVRFAEEEQASQLNSVKTQTAETRKNGGARRDRTDDLLLAKQALSQLSYGPAALPELSRGPADIGGSG